MGVLKQQIRQIDHVKNMIDHALSYFDKRNLDEGLVKLLSKAADLAFSDELLFEKFELWNEERDDDSFLFHIQKFFEKQNKSSFEVKDRDLSNKRSQIEALIENSTRDKQKKIFSQRVTQLAVERGLLTNEALGEYLGVSSEQARKYKSGENRPHLTTLKNLSEKFDVSVEFLMGLSS